MIENAKNTLGYKPTIVLADAGYFSYEKVDFFLREKLMLIFQTTFTKLRKKEKPGSSGNIFLHITYFRQVDNKNLDIFLDIVFVHLIKIYLI